MELTVEKLDVERGGRPVLSDTNLNVRAGEMLLLTGSNGSGKTTLLSAIAGLVPASGGRIRLSGGNPELGVGEQAHFIGHRDALKPSLTVQENLDFWCGFLEGARVDPAIAAFGLSALRDFPVAVLSAGQRRRLALSRLHLAARALWLLDEPTVGLDAASSARLVSHMQSHLEEGGIIIAASHVSLDVKAQRIFPLDRP
ncbi:MAG TPA: heme ABC exporter ATP-binding protein CcmA [Aestuariivirgaceae bacterium]|nr:heme ABC exporter ATP-binding protein CcmA [Aestuariivirgaceae bacterium]